MLHRSLYSICTIIAIFSFSSLYCTLPVDPATLDENVTITVSADSSTCLINERFKFKIVTALINLVDSIHISFGDGKDSVIEKKNIDTLISMEHVFTTDGEKTITVNAITASLTKNSTLKVSVVTPVSFIDSGAITVTGSKTRGTPLTLTVKSNGTYPIYYKWYKNGTALEGSDNASYVIQSLSDSDTGSYFCVVRNSHGSDTSVLYSVGYTQIPPLINNGKMARFNGKMLLDSAFSLFIEASGVDEGSFQWYKNGQKLVSENSDTLKFSLLRFADTGSYTCTVNNSFGADTSKPFKIVLESFVKKLVFVDSGRVFFTGAPKQDSTLKIFVRIEGDSREILRQWYKDGVVLSGQTRDTLLFDKVTSQNNGNYFCVISKNGDADTSLTYTIMVGTDIPPFIQNSRQVLSTGSTFKDSTLVLFIQAAGSSELKYQWYKNSVKIDGKVKDTLVLSQLKEADSGSYSCIVQNNFGADTSKSYVLKVKMKVARPEFADSGAIRTVGSMKLDGVFTMYIVLKDKQVQGTIQWYKNRNSIPGQNYDSLLISKLAYADTGSYFCIVKNDAGADTSKTFNISIAEKSEYTITPDVNITGGIISIAPVKNSYIEGDTVTIQARPDIGYSFTTWSKDITGTNNPMVVIVNKNMAIGAQFTPNGTIENVTASAGSSLNALIKKVSAAPVPGTIITPETGNYDNNTITIFGKVTIPVQRR